jgi:polyisoprenoid-binding protein YceI
MSTPLTDLQAPPAGRYALDLAGSSVTFETRHMFGLGRVRGTLAVTGGALDVAEPVAESSVRASVSAASFSTRNPVRDLQVRSRLFLDARRHPEISFRSTAVRRGADGWTVSGVVTVKGRPAPLDLTVDSIATDGDAVVFRASGTADRYAHGVTAMRGMAVRHLAVQVTARATRA